MDGLEEKQKIIRLTQIATSTAPAYILPDGKVVTMEEYLEWMGNLLYDIKRGIIG